ncbi:MAG: adenosylcobinamide-GDP ribazoletransferase [Pseudomonadota bacterium]
MSTAPPDLAFRALAALQYLTRLPVKLGRAPSEEEIPSLTAFYPAVGLVVGLCGLLVGGAVSWLAPEQSLLPGLLTIATWALVTGAFHIDGLADSFDGLLSGKRGEDAGKILKDSRVGVMGAVAVFLVLALQAVAAGSLLHAGHLGAVVLAPVVGRLAAVVVAFVCRPPDWAGVNSLGRLLVGKVQGDWLRMASVTALAAGVVLAWPFGWILLLAAGLGLGWAMARWAERVLGGVTGDVLGASVEVAQTAVLVLAVLLN